MTALPGSCPEESVVPCTDAARNNENDLVGAAVPWPPTSGIPGTLVRGESDERQHDR